MTSQRALTPCLTHVQGQFSKSPQSFGWPTLRLVTRAMAAPLECETTNEELKTLMSWNVEYNLCPVHSFICTFLLVFFFLMLSFVCVAEISNLLVVTKSRAPAPQTPMQESQFIFHRILKDEIKQVKLKPTLLPCPRKYW